MFLLYSTRSLSTEVKKSHIEVMISGRNLTARAKGQRAEVGKRLQMSGGALTQSASFIK